MNKKIKNAIAWRGIPLNMISDRNNVRTSNFISEKFQDSEDLESLGFDKETYILMHEKYTWATIAANIGLFPSVGIAKKSDWNHPIEDGYTEAFFSKSDGTPLFVFIMK